MTSQFQTPHPAASSAGATVGIVTLIAIAVMLLVAAFAWPAARSTPAGIAVAVTGDAELVAGFLAGAGPLRDIVELEQVEGRDEALSGIQRRDYIGGVVLAAGAPEVLFASAEGQAPAGIMREITGRLQSGFDEQLYAALRGAVERSPEPEVAIGRLPETLPAVTVTDVAEYSESDASGGGATVAGIPLSVGALLAGVVISFTVRGRWQRLAAVLGTGALGGLLVTLGLGSWLGVYPAPFAVAWLALGLSLTATSGLFAGLHAVFGRVGLGLAALLTLFAAMPLAAFAVPAAFLPSGLGAIGQWLIPGATVTLMRNLSYFPEASSSQQWWALSLWVLLALVLGWGRKGNPAHLGRGESVGLPQSRVLTPKQGDPEAPNSPRTPMPSD